MAKKTSLNDLRDHMFDVIERLKSNTDPDADQKDCIDVETAKAIAHAGTIIVNSAKIESDVIRSIANAQNPQLIRDYMTKSEILPMPTIQLTNGNGASTIRSQPAEASQDKEGA